VTALAPAPGHVDLGVALEARFSTLWTLLMTGTPPGLNRTAAAVVASLRDDGPQRVTDLARRERVAQPTMTAIVSRLRREGLVDGTTDPDDARATLLSVTDAGRAALQVRVDARAALLAERLAALDDDQRAAIDRALPALDALVPERTVIA
jgi:DNA-binding MarR family transcriptional regulator